MRVNDFFKAKLTSYALKQTSDEVIAVENALRRGEAVSGKVENAPFDYVLATMKNLKTALALAKAPEDPDRGPLLSIYENVLADLHLESIIESRILRAQSSKFRLVDKQGESDTETIELFQKGWFESYIDYFFECKFQGAGVIELFELNDDMELKEVTPINRRNLLTEKGLIVKEVGDTTGWNYKEGSLLNYYIQIGKDRDIGMLAKLSAIAIFKKFAVGNWSDYIEKFGVPPRWILTDATDEKRLKQLSVMMEQMIGSSWAILQKQLNESLEIMQTPGVDAHKVFDNFISRCNSEMSKKILGQDGTTDNKDASGNYGSLKILMDVADDRHEADKTSFKNHVNEVLIPKLIAISPTYKPLENLSFDWDDSSDLSAIELLTVVKDIPYEVDLDYLTEKTGIKFTGRLINQTTAAAEEGEEEKK